MQHSTASQAARAVVVFSHTLNACQASRAGTVQLACCALAMMAFGVLQGGQASEQLLAGSVCAAVYLRCAGASAACARTSSRRPMNRVVANAAGYVLTHVDEQKSMLAALLPCCWLCVRLQLLIYSCSSCDAGKAEAVWGLVAAATVWVPLAVTIVQQRRLWRQFIAAGAPAPALSQMLGGDKALHAAPCTG